MNAPRTALSILLVLAACANQPGPVPAAQPDGLADSGLFDNVTNADAAGEAFVWPRPGSDARLMVTLDGATPAPGACSLFPADKLGGVVTYKKKLILKNTGFVQSLCVHAVQFATDNPQLELTGADGPALAEGPCKGSLLELQPQKSATFMVEHAPDPDAPDPGGATIVITSSDPELATVELCVAIADGPRIAPHQNKLTFLNPSASDPPTLCVSFGNTGTKPLVFLSASLEPANAQFSIVESPGSGAAIPAHGDAGNSVANPKNLQICVSYTSNGVSGDDDTTLVIASNDPITPQVAVKLSAVWQQDNTFSVTCAALAGQVAYDFQGAKVGSKTAKCTIYNHGPAMFLFSKAPAVQAIANSDGQAEVTAAYQVQIAKPDGTVVNAPFGLGKGKSVDVVVTVTSAVIGPAPQGRVEIAYSQSNEPGVVLIPVLAGDCQVPAPDFGPVELWLQGALGTSSKGVVAIANQSCAPLHLVEACVTSAFGVTGTQPCNNTASPYFKLAQPFVPTIVAPWGIVPLEVELAPQNDSKTEINDLLHIGWCGGTWTAGQCSGATVYQSRNLSGSLDQQVALPKFALVPVTGAKAGQKLRIDGVFTAGTQNDGLNHAWLVLARPAGSYAWLPEAYQTTGGPFVTFVPDVAGTYTILATAQAIDGAGYSWSPQTQLELVVAP